MGLGASENCFFSNSNRCKIHELVPAVIFVEANTCWNNILVGGCAHFSIAICCTGIDMRNEYNSEKLDVRYRFHHP